MRYDAVPSPSLPALITPNPTPHNFSPPHPLPHSRSPSISTLRPPPPLTLDFSSNPQQVPPSPIFSSLFLFSQTPPFSPLFLPLLLPLPHLNHLTRFFSPSRLVNLLSSTTPTSLFLLLFTHMFLHPPHAPLPPLRLPLSLSHSPLPSPLSSPIESPLTPPPPDSLLLLSFSQKLFPALSVLSLSNFSHHFPHLRLILSLPHLLPNSLFILLYNLFYFLPPRQSTL